MQLHMRRLAFFVCGTTLMAGGLFAAACGTDNGNTSTPIPQVDGATPGKGDGSVKNDSGDTTDDDGGTLDASGADCATAPILRDNKKGFYCSFLFRDAGPDAAVSPTSCPSDEICCNPADNADDTHNTSFCATGTKGGSAEDTANTCKTYAGENDLAWPDNATQPGSAWECMDKNGCSDGQICCMFTASNYTDPKDKVNIGKYSGKDIPAACGVLGAFKQGGTHCVTGNQCPAGDKAEIKLCSKSDENCATGTTCTPVRAFYNRDIAYCR